MKIGENVYSMRKEKKLKRSELLKRIRYMYGNNALGYRTIQRIEHGENIKERLSSLLKIADALGVNVNELYKGTEYEDKAKQEEKLEEAYITRHDNRGGEFKYSKGASIEIVSPEQSGYIVFQLILDPGFRTKVEQDPEGTIKFLYLIEGEINVTVGNIVRVLYRGDTIQINSSKPHYFENKSKKRASAILYQNPKNF